MPSGPWRARKSDEFSASIRYSASRAAELAHGLELRRDVLERADESGVLAVAPVQRARVRAHPAHLAVGAHDAPLGRQAAVDGRRAALAITRSRSSGWIMSSQPTPASSSWSSPVCSTSRSLEYRSRPCDVDRVDPVGRGGRQRPEALLARRERLLEDLAVGDVDRLRQEVRGLAAVADEHDREARPDDGAVGAHVALLALVRILLAGSHLLACGTVARRVVGVRDVGDRHADELVLLAADHRGERAVRRAW